jgi:hypothetical protein
MLRNTVVDSLVIQTKLTNKGEQTQEELTRTRYKINVCTQHFNRKALSKSLLQWSRHR